jgi:glycosyltransferase involved in cell wall biosynthesis
MEASHAEPLGPTLCETPLTEGISAGLVSVVIPVYNRISMLREAVASVWAQTYRPVELILVDDGSTDGSGEACDRLAADAPELVQAVHTPNRGPGAAREAGRLLVRGEFVQYLDSDDLLLPRKLELQVKILEENPQAGVAYGYTRFRPRAGPPVEKPWKGSGELRETMFPWFLTERWWDTPTPLYRRSVTDRVGPWLPLWQEEDWEYDCRIAALGTRLVRVEEFVAEVRDHSEGRLSGGDSLDCRKLESRAQAHSLVYQHARCAGIGFDDPFMRQYARELFLLSRWCGAAGLTRHAQELFVLAREASGDRCNSLDFRVYDAVTRLLGWGIIGRLSCWSDSLRRVRGRIA